MSDRKPKVAWGITGSGDRLPEIVDMMKNVQEMYRDAVDIRVYISRAGDQVVKYYKLFNELEASFDKIWVEANANAPFLAGQLQLGKFAFLIIAPATSNTVAKISLRLADTLLTNAAIMAQKAYVPLYIMPSDYEEGVTITKLPDGRDLKLRIRREDVEHVRRLEAMDGTFVLRGVDEIPGVFEKHFGRP
ncbi:MAG: archaeoflavoprotein AfpA [Methanothrix sp.]|jgi:archaeoflavoprotein AfpA|uniref:Flavoprotein n=1 Tax=Methanothrix thermoacetophila (strain DSM 6194 / JCM 14653 / NBRC 101360 / PT) TaxID=349307 RepID=A0B5R8_METTP|nr:MULTISPECIES: archaeoflavoprotein AfpA [Methanothrix]ABK14042.1 flavoprotein [Methanothrix thermoacetophila PT]MBC7080208.1 archaeoflavoprotein AfpA [Methanothrix sp.]NPU87934.1 archaeoflavoprotein AfpA [Methanothrix sp.]